MDKIILVTCIIPTFNKFDYIYDALKSVTIQDYCRIELIICDDASTYFPKLDIEKYILENRKDNIENVIIHTNSSNVGTVKNMNTGLKLAKGDIFINLSSDDLLYDNTVISRVVKRFMDTGYDLISFRRLRCTETTLYAIRYMPDKGYLNMIRKRYNTAEKQYHAFGLGNTLEMASGASTYYTRSFIENYGYYDEEYRLWEDGPSYVKYVRNGNVINMAYDFISVKYRVGGISTIKGKKISPASKLIQKDYQYLLKKEYLPYLTRFNWFEKRVIKYRYLNYDQYFNKNITYKIKNIDVIIYLLICSGLRCFHRCLSM